MNMYTHIQYDRVNPTPGQGTAFACFQVLQLSPVVQRPAVRLTSVSMLHTVKNGVCALKLTGTLSRSYPTLTPCGTWDNIYRNKNKQLENAWMSV